MNKQQDNNTEKKIYDVYNSGLPSVLPKSVENALINCCLGQASPEQQRLALNTICYNFANLNMPSFDPESDKMTAFNEGKRSVGIKLLAFLNKYIPEKNG